MEIWRVANNHKTSSTRVHLFVTPAT